MDLAGETANKRYAIHCKKQHNERSDQQKDSRRESDLHLKEDQATYRKRQVGPEGHSQASSTEDIMELGEEWARSSEAAPLSPEPLSL